VYQRSSLFVLSVNEDDGNILYPCRQKSAVPAGTKKKPGKFSKKKDEEKELKPAEQKPVEAVVAKKPKVAILTLCQDPGTAPRHSA
jgi:ribosomal protein L24E